MSNQFHNSGPGEQNVAQGDHAIGKQVNNYGVPYEAYGELAGKLAVTETALASFFKILKQESIPCAEWGAKLPEIAFRHKELLLRFEAVQSDDPQVQALKKQAGQAIAQRRGRPAAGSGIASA